MEKQLTLARRRHRFRLFALSSIGVRFRSTPVASLKTRQSYRQPFDADKILANGKPGLQHCRAV